MTPLFVNGNYNREGKRIRARYIKTLSFDGNDYPLWVSAGKNENDYPNAVNDTHYLRIQAGSYLVPCGHTEYDLEQRSGYSRLESEWYGGYEAREEFYSKMRDGKSYEESYPQIKAQLEKENEAILGYGKDESVQAEYLKKKFIDPAIAAYIDARDNGGMFANFQGAAFLGEVGKCAEINIIIMAERKKADAIKRAEREKREAAAEIAEIKETEKAFVSGGSITNARLIVKIADQCGINIHIRTKRWILNKLVECTILENGSVSYRFRGTKGTKGSGGLQVHGILVEIQNALKNHKAA